MKNTKKTLKKYQAAGQNNVAPKGTKLDGSKTSEIVKSGIRALQSKTNEAQNYQKLGEAFAKGTKAQGDSIVKFQRATIVDPKPKKKKGGSIKR